MIAVLLFAIITLCPIIGLIFGMWIASKTIKKDARKTFNQSEEKRGE